MKCKRHPYEEGVGVCAPCLRDRLLALISAQLKHAEEESLRHNRRLNHFPPPPLPETSDPPPLPAFPRSVSPYICRFRRSADESGGFPWRKSQSLHSRFYSTPQVGPAAASGGGRRRGGRFSLLSSLFGSASRSGEIEAESKQSWLSLLFSGHRRKKSRPATGNDTAAGRCRGAMDRGLSPVASDGADSPVSESGYSTESSGGWRRRTAMTHPTPMRRWGPAPPPHMRTLSGLAFCLSPHVRASPRRRRTQKSEPVTGEFHNRHVCANRSRKIADFGRDWSDKYTIFT
ncbi:hypothetical protein QJS04_geneDACA012075 [Acorus gramineus]|uniref:Uncharacterized protein n=1 Tax=Acorus gramineus TaxID=55184 RepID=A0AAV9BA42_ACOGR|nr:hypothetical protein QJS04_geneDACA012075 [Acorus gramineus]